IYKHGSKWHGKLLVLFFVKKPQARVGFTVSKKVGCAVVRNKIRRQLREVYRANRASLQAGDLVIVAKVGAAQSHLVQFNKEVVDASHYLGIYKPKESPRFHSTKARQ
ncbi:MAG: ribonuclease P protein component, partial [Helicobacter sp.]|nr:ribonuclease P protein component [Helicobacter sp.]